THPLPCGPAAWPHVRILRARGDSRWRATPRRSPDDRPGADDGMRALRAAPARGPVRRFAAVVPTARVVRNLPKETSERRALEPFCDATSVEVDKGVDKGDVTIDTAEVTRAHGATARGRKIAVKLSDAAPARKAPTAQRSGGRGAAIALNKRLVSSETAADVLSVFEDKGAAYDFMNFATSLHRLGVLGRSFKQSSAPLLHKLVDRATSSLINESKQWEPRHLANACWGIAKIGNVEAPALFEAIAGEASKKIATFNSQDLANIMWAYATARVEAPALFAAVAAEAPKKISTFKSQELANTIWAYSTAGIEAPALFEAIAVESSKKIATFTPQALANTVWAYATAGVEAPTLFKAVATEAPKKIATF
ncbi:hypothetical protein M885DRAFT_4965, partial [Pelagophyceae sp. CCMP2097]